jgi:phage terminase small subunit
MNMIKPCKFCFNNFNGPKNKLYCSKKCKKSYENAQRGAPGKRRGRIDASLSADIKKPSYLDGYAAAYWDKVAPVLVKRGHLNILSEDAFAELCDCAMRLRDINAAINETNRSLLQIDDKWDNKAGVESQSFKESALSDIKRKYSNLLLVYCKQFYLTPLSNRGNFGMVEDETDPLDKFIKGKNGK